MTVHVRSLLQAFPCFKLLPRGWTGAIVHDDTVNYEESRGAHGMRCSNISGVFVQIRKRVRNFFP